MGIEFTGSGTARLGISPTNPSGYGKARDTIQATAIIGIGTTYSMDYRSIPGRATRSGSVQAVTIGRF